MFTHFLFIKLHLKTTVSNTADNESREKNTTKAITENLM